MIRRGYFRGFIAAEKTETLGSLAAYARPWDSNLSGENEIECYVDRLRPPPKADIAISTCYDAVMIRGGGNETA